MATQRSVPANYERLPPQNLDAERSVLGAMLLNNDIIGAAVEILREAEKLADGSGLVFPGKKRGNPHSDITLSRLVKELGFDADVHGFRSSFRMWAQEQTNFPREVAEAALAHVIQNKAEAAYARSDVFEKRRKMMESWARYLAGRRGEVVALQGGH